MPKYGRYTAELLQVLLDNKQYLSSGLCHLVYCLVEKKTISRMEGTVLHHYIESNRPSKFSSLEAFLFRNSDFYWGRESIKPRLKWLKKHIKKNSKYSK